MAAQDAKRGAASKTKSGSQAREEVAIVATGLTKKYGHFVAVDGLDLTVFKGEIFGLLGPNGAGKTTTILMLLGLTEPTAGTARVSGFDPVREPLSVKSIVGYLPDNVGFYPNMSGRHNLLYTASLNRIPRKEAAERADVLLEQVGLTEAAGKRAGTYSRGMRQRLAVADALIKRPSILILDEPTIGIDPEGVHDLLALLERLKTEESMTILLSSHLLHQVQEICDRVGIFVGGHLIATGPVDDLERQLAEKEQSEYEIQVVKSDGHEIDDKLRDEAGEALKSLRGVSAVSSERGVLKVHSRRDTRFEAVRSLLDLGLVPVLVRQRGLSLDDIYDRYFQGEVDSGHDGA
jgi:ABC-2 type transport system ATP-binding protein